MENKKESCAVALPRQTQPATSEANNVTASATNTQPKTLKALALENLQCNNQCNQTATEGERDRNFSATNEGQKLRTILQPKTNATEIFRQAAKEINADYTVGCLSWARENLPELHETSIEVEDRLNSAFKARNSSGYSEAVGQYVDIHKRIINLYKMRDSCQDSGHCLQTTQEMDCDRFPQESGFCRERAGLGGGFVG